MASVDVIFSAIDAALALDPALGKKVGGVLLFVLTSSKKEFTVDCKAGKVTEGKGAKADCTLTISDENFMAMSEGKLNGMQAYMGGKLKLAGNMALAQKFGTLMDAAKKAAAAPAASAAAPATAPTAASSGLATTGFKCDVVFNAMASNLASNPALAKKVNGIFLFVITGGPDGMSAEWTVDAQKDMKVVNGKGAKPGVTITISDDDFVAVSTGKLNGMQAYMGGKMKLAGNMMLAQKIGALAESGPKAKL